MNKLEILQDRHGINNVFLVARWPFNGFEWFKYYIKPTNAVAVSCSNNANIDKMLCKTVQEGLNEGVLDEQTVVNALIDYHDGKKVFPTTGEAFSHLNTYLAEFGKKFTNRDLNWLVVLKSGKPALLKRLFKNEKHHWEVEVESEGITETIPVSQVVRFFNDWKLKEDYLKWCGERRTNARFKDVQYGFDISIARFIKGVLMCK